MQAGGLPKQISRALFHEGQPSAGVLGGLTRAIAGFEYFVSFVHVSTLHGILWNTLSDTLILFRN